MTDRQKSPGRMLYSALKLGVVALIFFFLVRVLVRNWSELGRHEFGIDPVYLIGSALMLIPAYAGTFLLWDLLTRWLGVSVALGRAVGHYAISALGKYVPGKVWMPAARFVLYEREGKGRALLSVAVAMEPLLHAAGSAAIFLVAVLIVGEQQVRFLAGVVPLVLAALAVAMHPRILERLLNAGLRMLGRDPVRIRIRYRDVIFLLVLYIALYQVYYLSFFLLIRCVYHLPLQQFPYIALCCSAAGIVSMIAVFAPAGLGVREGMFFLLLRGVMPESLAVIVALLNRIVTLLVELAVIGIVLLVSKRSVRYDEAPKGEQSV